MLDAQAREKLDKTLGLVAEVTAAEFNKRFQSGDYGPILTAVSAPTPVEPVRGVPRAAAPQPIQSPISESLNEALDDCRRTIADVATRNRLLGRRHVRREHPTCPCGEHRCVASL